MFEPNLSFDLRAQNKNTGMAEMTSRSSTYRSDGTLVCQCGSTEFSEQRFNQFYRDMYGSLPGGDLQPRWDAWERVLVCLACGRTHRRRERGFGKTADAQMRSFNASFELSAKHREEIHSLPSFIQELREQAAPQAALLELAGC